MNRKKMYGKKKISRSKPKPLFIIPLIFLIVIYTMYVLNIEIPIPLSSQYNYTIDYRNLNTSITLYKIYTFDSQKETLLQIDGIIRKIVREKTNDSYIYLGTHRISKNKEIIFINYTSSIILDNGKYIAYLAINKTFTGIPIVYIDANYSKSFDTIVNYYPYQFHFIIRVQKCGIKLTFFEVGVMKKFFVKIINEDTYTKIIRVDSAINKTYFFDICGDRIEVESYLSPIPLITLKELSTYTNYLVLSESPLIALIFTPILLYIFIKSFIRHRIISKKV
jgi:hypothetical protein